MANKLKLAVIIFCACTIARVGSAASPSASSGSAALPGGSVAQLASASEGDELLAAFQPSHNLGFEFDGIAAEGKNCDGDHDKDDKNCKYCKDSKGHITVVYDNGKGSCDCVKDGGVINKKNGTCKCVGKSCHEVSR